MMFRAPPKSSQVLASSFPHPVTGQAKNWFSRGLWPAATGCGGRVAELLQAQPVEYAALSAFCNAATLATRPSRDVRGARGGCGGAAAHGRARCVVAPVAMLQNRDCVYTSITWNASNLQRSCNGRNAGPRPVAGLLLADPGQDVEYVRKSSPDQVGCVADAAAWPMLGRSGVMAARAAAVAGGRAGAGEELVDEAAHAGGAGPAISMSYRPFNASDTGGCDTGDAKSLLVQWVSGRRALVARTCARQASPGRGLPPPHAGPPTPQTPTRRELHARLAAIASLSGGHRAAKSRRVGSGTGPGSRGSQGRGPGASGLGGRP